MYRVFGIIYFLLCLASLSAGERAYKIYDCFNFFNEFDLLSVRLRELSDRVDYFVLVESAETFRGNPKPLYFEENKHKFQPYLHQIIHVVVNDRFEPWNSNPWPREAFQRNQIMRGLRNCSSDDVVIINDADEIIRAECLDQMVAMLHTGQDKIVGCDQDFYRYFFNRKEQYDWIGSAMTTYRHVSLYLPEGIRQLRNSTLVLPKGGWHFTNMGGLNAYFEKLVSFSHFEGDIPENRDPVQLYNKITQSLYRVEIDGTYPKYVQEHLEYFKTEGLIDDGTGYR